MEVCVSFKPGAEPLMGGYVAYGEQQSEVQPFSHQLAQLGPARMMPPSPGAEERTESFPQRWEFHSGSPAGGSVQAGRQGQVSRLCRESEQRF